jgi:hypothetical protein
MPLISLIYLILSISLTGGFGSNVGSGNPNTTNFTYTFHGDPRATFAEFFGTNNPFESFFTGTTPGKLGCFIADKLFLLLCKQVSFLEQTIPLKASLQEQRLVSLVVLLLTYQLNCCIDFK